MELGFHHTIWKLIKIIGVNLASKKYSKQFMVDSLNILHYEPNYKRKK